MTQMSLIAALFPMEEGETGAAAVAAQTPLTWPEPPAPERAVGSRRKATRKPKPHCACGCTSALADGTPTGECDCYLTHPEKMRS